MTKSTPTLRAPQAQSFDVEAQQRITPKQSNEHLTRAKLVAMATVSAAGGLATALMATANHTEPNAGNGRTLLNQGCSEEQLNKIAAATRALIISGALTGAGIVTTSVFCCVGLNNMENLNDSGGGNALKQIIGCIGGTIYVLGHVATIGGAFATVGSSIAYGVETSRC